MLIFHSKDFEEANEEVVCQVLSNQRKNNFPDTFKFFEQNRNAENNYSQYLKSQKKSLINKKKTDMLYKGYYSLSYEGNNRYVGQLFSLENSNNIFTINLDKFVEGMQMLALISRKNGYSISMKSLQHYLSKETWEKVLHCCENIFKKQTLNIYS